MVIGGTLAWSGNYRIAIDNDNAHTTRIFAGINEDQSQYILEPKEVFTTPVFAFTFSDEGKGRRQPQLPPLGAAAPAQPRRRAAQHPAQQLGRRLDERQPGGDGSDDGRLRRHGRGDVRDGRRLVRRQIPAQQRHVEPRRLGGLQGETPRGHQGADGLGPGRKGSSSASGSNPR